MTMEGPLYPVGLVVRGRRCLVVGGGRVAARKVQSLLACGATVTMVAPEVHEALGILAANGAIAAIEDAPLDVQLRPYKAGEAADYRLVITATGVRDVDAAVFADADGAGVWVNSADDPDRCTFVLPAVWRDGPVTVAVSSGATSPALAGWLRDRVAEAVPPAVGTIAEVLGEARRSVRQAGRSTESVDWRSLLESDLPRLVAEGRIDDAKALVIGATKEHNDPVD